MLTFEELSEGLTGILWTIFLSFFIKIKLLHNKKVKRKHSQVQLLPLLSIHTQIFDGVIALFIVHFDGLGVRAANAITNGITSDHNVLVLWRSPAYYDASDKWADMKRTRYFRNTSFWEGN